MKPYWISAAAAPVALISGIAHLQEGFKSKSKAGRLKCENLTVPRCCKMKICSIRFQFSLHRQRRGSPWEENDEGRLGEAACGWRRRGLLWWTILPLLENYWFCPGPNRRWWWHRGESITEQEAAAATKAANVCPLPSVSAGVRGHWASAAWSPSAKTNEKILQQR